MKRVFIALRNSPKTTLAIIYLNSLNLNNLILLLLLLQEIKSVFLAKQLVSSQTDICDTLL